MKKLISFLSIISILFLSSIVYAGPQISGGGGGDLTSSDIGVTIQYYDADTLKKAAAALTDGQYTCADSNGEIVSCGAPVTDNSTASHVLCKDSAGEVENCGGVTISGTTSPIINVNPQEVDGHVTSTDLTAAQVSNTVIHNYDQAASDVFLIAPAAAAGYSMLFNVVTAQSNHWCFEAAATDKIYLIAAAGTIAAGDDGAAVCMMAAQIGQSFACWTFKSGASSYDWACKAIAIGTSTFEAHASSE